MSSLLEWANIWSKQQLFSETQLKMQVLASKNKRFFSGRRGRNFLCLHLLKFRVNSSYN